MAVGLKDTPITLRKILRPTDTSVRKTKIVCTIGPSCWDVETLVKMIDAGMNVARLNFSHGDHGRHAETLEAVRAAVAQRRGSHVAIMLDTKGPEIRTGFLKDHEPVKIEAGAEVFISTNYDEEGTAERFSCSYKKLPTSVKPGQTILVADGSLVFTVKECQADGVLVEARNGGKLGERKNMNLPGVIVELPTITAKDEDDLVNFAVPQRVDLIAASFVRKGSDIRVIRETLGEAGAGIKIVAKIENQEGLQNFDDILEEADGIMVARGDLGMEIPPEKVFLAQKMMIRKCNTAGKPVITATQMLESMTGNPRPTRAEASDVANAVLDGTDCVMLSGETAGGAYPLEAVQIMSRICAEAESIINYNALYSAMREIALETETSHGSGMLGEGGAAGGGGGPGTLRRLKSVRTLFEMGVPESIASSGVKTAIDMGARTIIVCSETGNSARLIAKYRPEVPVLVLTATDEVARWVQGMNRGCRAVATGSMLGTDALLVRAVEMCRDWEWVRSGDKVVAIHGMIEGRPGSTNMLKVLNVP